MKKIIIRLALYFMILILVYDFYSGTKYIIGSVPEFLVLSLILAGINTIIRPFFTLIALPFNLVTLGIASVFVNMLTLQIADGICKYVDIKGFWMMTLISVLIMIADSCIGGFRRMETQPN